jgi:hypothetical protein
LNRRRQKYDLTIETTVKIIVMLKACPADAGNPNSGSTASDRKNETKNPDIVFSRASQIE